MFSSFYVGILITCVRAAAHVCNGVNESNVRDFYCILCLKKALREILGNWLEWLFTHVPLRFDHRGVAVPLSFKKINIFELTFSSTHSNFYKKYKTTYFVKHKWQPILLQYCDVFLRTWLQFWFYVDCIKKFWLIFDTLHPPAQNIYLKWSFKKWKWYFNSLSSPNQYKCMLSVF